MCYTGRRPETIEEIGGFGASGASLTTIVGVSSRHRTRHTPFTARSRCPSSEPNRPAPEEIGGRHKSRHTLRHRIEWPRTLRPSPSCLRRRRSPTRSWEACRRPDGRERDLFDGPAAFHLLGEEDDEIVAYARFLPTTRPHLLSHLYPEIMQGGSAPKGPAIYEWTRQAIVARRREMPDADLFAAAVSGAIALVVHALNLDGLLIEFHPAHIPRLLDTGWDVRPLALPTSYEGSKIVPVYARATGRTLNAAQAAFAAWPSAQLRLPHGLVGRGQLEATIQ
ncbi:hypothetical protein CCS92_06615 [Methylobacterium radiotolerans]|nr:hypothetical protein CCS92_06615 [Methylobacterium radiotolerans]